MRKFDDRFNSWDVKEGMYPVSCSTCGASVQDLQNAEKYHDWHNSIESIVKTARQKLDWHLEQVGGHTTHLNMCVDDIIRALEEL